MYIITIIVRWTSNLASGTRHEAPRNIALKSTLRSLFIVGCDRSLDPEGERYRGLELVEPRRVLRLSMPRQIDGDAMQVN